MNVWTNGRWSSLSLENIFTQQPSYFSDLDETLPTVLQVLLSSLAQGSGFFWKRGIVQRVEGSKRGHRQAECICCCLLSLVYANVCQVGFESLSKTITWWLFPVTFLQLLAFSAVNLKEFSLGSSKPILCFPSQAGEALKLETTKQRPWEVAKTWHSRMG